MRSSFLLSSRGRFLKTSCMFALPIVLALAALPSFAAELSVQYEVIARSGVTPIPNGTGTFTAFGTAPAIDAAGNVVFNGAGTGQAGVYTAIGSSLQRVADKNTPIPGGSGNFALFPNTERHDIDGGRVAFKATDGAGKSGLYTNVGQASSASLVRIALIDGTEWSAGSEPWVDGNTVAMRGTQAGQIKILRWNGSNNFVNPGTGYSIGSTTQASISGAASIFHRTGATSEIAIANGSAIESLAIANTTLMPGLGVTFTTFYPYQLVDRGGADAAFLGFGSQKTGLFKRVNGGALQNVVDTTKTVPGTSGDIFKIFNQSNIALANGQVVFVGSGQYSLKGLYTDIGGALSVLFDNEGNNTIDVGGETLTISDFFDLGTRSFAYTPQGYMVVFRLNFNVSESAIIRATIGSAPTGTGTFTVNKDFSDNSTASVSVTLACTSGTVTNNPRTATEAAPAVFNISGAATGATCTASESPVPSGYTANQTDCQNGDPIGGTCTIVNTKNTTNSFTVRKDFSDNATAGVSVTLACTSGTVTNNPRTATEAAPAVFTISGAATGTTCTASESPVPSGYTANQTDCQNGDPLNGTCTIVNTRKFTVYKDFSDNATASVSVTLACTSGTVTNNPRTATEAAPAVFSITGSATGATCTASESPVPTGYTANQTDCQNGDPMGGTCTIVNTKNTTSFTVRKDFSDNATAGVSVTLTCSSGTVTNNPRTATEAAPAVFTITGAATGATCTASESPVPSGYTANQTDCQNGDPLNGTCTIINTKNTSSFTVLKDFSDNSTASVSITLTCTSGTVNNPRTATEAAPAVFTITGAATGATCTASESPVPTGYTANQTDCQNGDPLGGTCTIVNTLTPVVVIYDGFEDGNANGWSLGSGTAIDGTLAIGQYSLRHNPAANSTYSLSTAGYSGVTVQMNLAASSLKKNAGCFAEVSTDGGSSWLPVVQIYDPQDTGAFLSSTVTPAAASNNLNLRLRFRSTGSGRGGYCYGDEVTVKGTLNGG